MLRVRYIAGLCVPRHEQQPLGGWPMHVIKAHHQTPRAATPPQTMAITLHSQRGMKLPAAN
jgi:hypothetical protein